MMGSSAVLSCSYDYRLVALSILISIVASYAVLDLAERLTALRGWPRLVCLGSGALTMGLGIWAMHYVGMHACHLPIPVYYDWPTVVLSLLAAVVASAVALYVVSKPIMDNASLVAGSIFMGCGIAAMHYIGMAAMRLQARLVYSPWIVTLSVALAIAISFVALLLAFSLRETRVSWTTRKLCSALLMGLAIPVMHYVGMAATSFVPQPALNASMQHAILITPFGLALIAIAITVILGHVCMLAALDRRFSRQTRLLAEHEARLLAIFDNLTEGIVVLDAETLEVQTNRAAADLLGIPSTTASFDIVRELLEIRSLDGALLPIEQWPGLRALRGEFVRNLEVELRSKVTGKGVFVAMSSAPINNPAGGTAQYILSYRDITERELSNAARMRMAAIVESSEDAIIGKNLQGIITSWNGGAEKIFGYAAEEMIGQSIRCLLPSDRTHEEDEILALIRQGETINHFETVRKRKDDRQIRVSLTISPILDAQKNVVGVSKIARDITQTRLLQEQLRHSQKMDALGQLTGGIVHDFNNLLGAIVGNLDLLERSLAGNEEALKRVRTAQKAATRGANLTRRLLAFSSCEALNPGPVSIETTIREMEELAGRTLGPEIRVVTHCDADIPPVTIDAAALENALLNLLVNARDAMPKGGSVTIGAHIVELGSHYPLVQTGEINSGSYACISVSDTGHGMSRQTLERAVEPFFTTKSREKGTGLGLAMVYGFIKQSGGALRLYSEEGFGTTVSLYLPLTGETAAPTAAVEVVHLPGKLGSTALLVDDEPALLEIAEAYLTEMGYTVLQAQNGSAAFDLLAQAEEIDLLVTDVIMPGAMNGIELAQKVRELRPGIRVIFTSGFPAEALAERSGRLMDGPLLRKPYQRNEFLGIVAKTMSESPHYQRFEASNSVVRLEATGATGEFAP
jgi:PAS domain S-box-containing protein